MKTLSIKTKNKQYNIYIGHNIIAQFSKIIKKEKIKFKKSLIVVDKNVPKVFIKIIKSKLKCKKKLVYLFQKSSL